MKLLRHLLNRSYQPAASPFDRYYGGIVRPGAGYPTADEARRDLFHSRFATAPLGWMR